MLKKRICNRHDLECRIQSLETLQTEQVREFKSTFRDVAQRLSPSTLIKKGIQNVVETPGLKTTAVNTALSSSAGHLGKLLFVRGSHNVFRKLAGLGVQFLVENFVRNKLPSSHPGKKLPADPATN
jgi:hypothetical protein